MSSKEVSIKRNIPSIGLMVATGACIFYYLLIYIPANEARVKLRGARQLNRFGQNLAAAYDGLDQGVRSVDGRPGYVDQTLLWADSIRVPNGVDYSDGTVDILLTWRSNGTRPQAYTTNVDSLVHPIEDFNEFEDIIVVDVGKANHGRVLDKSGLNLAYYPVHDSLLNHGVRIEKVKLSSQEYYAFHKRLNLGNSQLAVVGFISKGDFDLRARQVPPSIIIFFLLGFLLLLLAWPILKLLLVNEHERLTGNDIKLTNYAVLLGASFFAITFCGSYFFLVSAPTGTDDMLKRLSLNMSTKFNKEIKERKEVLKDETLFPTTPIGKRPETFSFNEIFSVDSETGEVVKLLTEPDNTKYDKFASRSIDVKTRPYYTVLVEPVKLGMSDTYFLQSIRSRSTGFQECAISTPFQLDDETIPEIRVITSTLRSVMDPILPSNYGFVVFDRDGMVQFHSDSRKVLNENFIEECAGNTHLKSFIGNNANGFISINYSEHDCRAYFQPLTADWYIVTFYNSRNIGNFASSVISFSLVSFSSILLYIILLHLLFRIDRPSFRVLRSRPFFYQWLNPTTISREKLMFLSFILCGVVVLDVVWFAFGTSIVGTFFWVLLTITLIYSIAYRLLRPKAKAAFSKATIFEMMCYGLIAVWWLLFLVNSFNNAEFIGVGLAVLIAILYAILYRKASVFDIRKTEVITSKGNYRLYRVFLLCCLLTMSVVPSLILFKDHLTHERIIRTRKTAISQTVKLNPLDLTQEVNLRKGGPYLNYDSLLGDYHSVTTVPEDGYNDYFHDGDAWFYDQTSSYFGQDDIDHSGLVVPNDQIAWDFRHDADRVYLKPRDTTSSNSHWSSVDLIAFPFETFSAPAIPMFIIAALLLFWAFWMISFEISRRVFYLPLYHRSSWRPAALKIPASTENAMGTVHAFSAKVGTNIPIKVGDSILTFRQLAPKFEIENELTHIDIKLLGGPYNKLAAEFEMNTLTTRKVFEPYFSEAWDTLKDEERYFLYDLAQDGIVNQYDKKMMDRMTEKGFIRLLPLEISHPAIGEFILDGINQEYLTKMDTKARAEGRWSSFRVPLAIVIIATLGFLSIVQEGLFAQISALLASVTLILPTLLNLLSSLPKLLPGKGGGGGV